MPQQNFAAGLETLGRRLLWLSMALIFLAIGLQKLTAYEAAAVAPLARQSPFLAWAYGLLGARGASFLFAAIEIPTGVGLLIGVARPKSWPARAGALGAAVVSFVTASFVLTAPGALIRHGPVPLLSLPVGQLFAKDLVLLAVAVVLIGASFRKGR